MPLYEGGDAQLERDTVAMMRGGLWEKVMGGCSKPGKMPALAWGIPATKCYAGSEQRLSAPRNGDDLTSSPALAALPAFSSSPRPASRDRRR